MTSNFSNKFYETKILRGVDYTINFSVYDYFGIPAANKVFNLAANPLNTPPAYFPKCSDSTFMSFLIITPSNLSVTTDNNGRSSFS